MTDLQMLVKQTSNSSINRMQQRLHSEVVELGKMAVGLKNENEALIKNRDQQEKDFLLISRETDETIATLKAEVETLKIALIEVIKVLESDDPAIVDTVWVSTGQPETLRDHCFSAVYGEEYEVKP